MSQNQRSPEAFRSPELFDRGMGYVVVSRFKGSGRVEMGVFLVDTYCLGVKDAFFTRAESLEEYEKVLDQIFPGGREEMPAAAARKLVEQAVAYASGLGLAPAADYKKGARVFGGIHAEDWPEDFTFGKDGRPFFINGPNDTPARCQQIIGALERSCGPGNYDYTMVSDFDDEEFEEWDEDELDEADERASEGMKKMAEELQKNSSMHLSLINPPGLPKLSDRLGEVLLPFMEEGKSLEEVRDMYEMAAEAWNLPMLPWYKRLQITRRVKKRAGSNGVEMFRLLVERRLELFPDDRRLAVNVEVDDAGVMGLDVRVAYAINPEDLPEGLEIPDK